MSSGVSLASWGEGAFLALVAHPSSDRVTIKILYGGRCFVTSTSLAPRIFLLGCLKLNLILLLGQLRLALVDERWW